MKHQFQCQDCKLAAKIFSLIVKSSRDICLPESQEPQNQANDFHQSSPVKKKRNRDPKYDYDDEFSEPEEAHTPQPSRRRVQDDLFAPPSAISMESKMPDSNQSLFTILDSCELCDSGSPEESSLGEVELNDPFTMLREPSYIDTITSSSVSEPTTSSDLDDIINMSIDFDTTETLFPLLSLE